MRQRLRSALRTALGGRSQLLLDLFSGSGGLARAASQLGLPSLSMDIANGSEFDLTDSRVLNTVLGWISSRVARSVWIAFPCSSWSRARVQAIRSKDHIYGLPNQKPVDVLKLQIGNRTLAAARRVIRACIRYGVPCIAENPVNSMAWMEPVMNRLLLRGSLLSVDMCQFGTPWRKRTRLASWHAAPALGMARLCRGEHGRCSRTGDFHLILKGTRPGSSIPWTKVAEPYCTAFCRCAAQWLVRSGDAGELRHMYALAS